LTTKQYLEDYRKLVIEVKSKRAELEVWESLAEGTGICTCNTAGGKTTKYTSDAAFVPRVEKIIEIKRELEAAIQELSNRREEIASSINAIPNRTYRSILTLRYLCGMEWYKVAQAIGYSEDHTRGWMHGKALMEFSKVNTP
jgi:tRNA(Ser,Leu) C12 N-acetylase TAN1